MVVPYVILALVAMVMSIQDTCPFLKYTGSFEEDIRVLDHALVGFSYKNKTISSIHECFSLCVTDCRCLSYQVSRDHCEVMYENRHTVKKSKFIRRSGSLYFELQQKFVKEAFLGNGCGGICKNGCCGNVQCLNGGKCIETCRDVNQKFVCECTPRYEGKFCENEKPAMSCSDLSKRGEKSGIHTILLQSGRELVVYCDMTSQSGHAWTLIESFEFEKNQEFQDKSFAIDFPVNDDKPEWKEYRMSREDMHDIKRHTTLWRATCNYNNDGFEKRDSMRGLIGETDIFAATRVNICRKVQYINIRGLSCSSCTTHLNLDPNRHPYVDSNYGNVIKCQWSATQGSFSERTPIGYYSYDDNFGYYLVRNKEHRCTSSPESTTQWWLGASL